MTISGARHFYPLVLFCAVTAARADEASDIARIHREAIGGSVRIAALTAVRMTGTIVIRERHVPFTMLAARPNRVRLQTEDNGHVLIAVSDGREPPWEYDSGSPPPRYRTMSETAAKSFTADAEFDDPLVGGSARGFTLEFAGMAISDGGRQLRILVTKNLSETFSLLIDEETYCILKRVDERVHPDGRKRLTITRYEDFRPVEEVLMPHKITLIIDGRVEQQMIIRDIEANPVLAPETFAVPKGESIAPGVANP